MRGRRQAAAERLERFFGFRERARVRAAMRVVHDMQLGNRDGASPRLEISIEVKGDPVVLRRAVDPLVQFSTDCSPVAHETKVNGIICGVQMSLQC